MSPGGSAEKEHYQRETENASRIETPPLSNEPTDLTSLLQQLTYCLALAKRLADASLAEATKQ